MSGSLLRHCIVLSFSLLLGIPEALKVQNETTSRKIFYPKNQINSKLLLPFSLCSTKIDQENG